LFPFKKYTNEISAVYLSPWKFYSSTHRCDACSQTPDIEVALSGPIDPPTMHH
jgi:hypothetical protein